MLEAIMRRTVRDSSTAGLFNRHPSAMWYLLCTFPHSMVSLYLFAQHWASFRSSKRHPLPFWWADYFLRNSHLQCTVTLVTHLFSVKKSATLGEYIQNSCCRKVVVLLRSAAKSHVPGYATKTRVAAGFGHGPNNNIPTTQGTIHRRYAGHHLLSSTSLRLQLGICQAGCSQKSKGEK